MTKVKKACTWLFGNFFGSLIVCWLPLLVIQNFLDTGDPDSWDYGIVILMFVALALMLVTDIITDRRKIAKKNL